MDYHYWTHRVVQIAALNIVFTFVAIGLWDLFLIYKNALAGNSASRVILEISMKVPIWVAGVALILGVLAGHFWWPQRV